MEGGLTWYFAYGSNVNALRLFEERLKPGGVAVGERIAGRLDGWRLAFNKRMRALLRWVTCCCCRRKPWRPWSAPR